jgi:hypothetical protein
MSCPPFQENVVVLWWHSVLSQASQPTTCLFAEAFAVFVFFRSYDSFEELKEKITCIYI